MLRLANAASDVIYSTTECALAHVLKKMKRKERKSCRNGRKCRNRPRTQPIEKQQVALPKLITVAIKQEAGEDLNCAGCHHSHLEDDEG